ncbi:MAG: CrcB family protein [Steroidobacteraceae bacterium]
MKAILIVGLGGLIGSVARYKAGGWVLHLTVLEKFPYSTFAVNVIGCFVAGVLASLDTLYLLRRGELMTAATYAGLNMVLGVAAVWPGFRLIASWPQVQP